MLVPLVSIVGFLSISLLAAMQEAYEERRAADEVEE